MSSGKIRLKDIDADSKAKYETLSPNVKAFVKEYDETFGGVFKITSGKREAKNKVGANHDHSKHNTGDALDFSAVDYEHYNNLVNTKEGLALMAKYNLGILDETDPENMKKTKATGAHFHLGIDPALAKNTKTRLQSFDEGVEPIISYKQRYEMGEKPKSDVNETANTNVIVPFEQKQYEDVFTRVAEKEIIKEVKTEKSEARKEIQKEVSQQEQFLKEYMQEVEKQKVQQQSPAQQQEERQPINFNIQVQEQLPELPNIFQIPEMKEGGTVVSGNTTVVTDKEGNKTTKVIGKDGKTYIKVETKDGKVYNKVVQPMRSTMSYKESEDYKNGIQYPVIINQSDNTNVTKPYIKNTQSKELIADIEGQKALANQLVTSGAASRYLGDKYWNQKGDESLRDMILKEIQRNPNLMKAIEKQEYKYLIDREQKAYDKASPFEKTASFIHSAVSDPVLVGSNLLEGKAPMLWQGVNLRDDRNPEVQRFYNQATGANNNIVNTVFNTINPGNIGANASQNVKEGDYLGVAMDVAELIGLGAGAIKPVNYAKVLNKLDDFTTNTYDKVATGNSVLPVAWKMEQPIANANTIKNSRVLTDEEAEVLRKYTEDPLSVSMNPEYRKIIDNIVKTSSADLSQNNQPLTRINSYYVPNPKLPIKYGEKIIYPSQRSWSLGVRDDLEGMKNIGRQRLVIPTKYTKQAEGFHALDYTDPRLTTHTVNIKAEKEIFGNVPEGYKIIGKSNEGGFENIFVKPIKSKSKVTKKPIDPKLNQK